MKVDFFLNLWLGDIGSGPSVAAGAPMVVGATGFAVVGGSVTIIGV